MHDHDKAWANGMIARLPYHYRQVAIDGYANVYSEAYDNEPVEHKKANAARFAANTRLREFCDLVAQSANENA